MAELTGPAWSAPPRPGDGALLQGSAVIRRRTRSLTSRVGERRLLDAARPTVACGGVEVRPRSRRRRHPHGGGGHRPPPHQARPDRLGHPGRAPPRLRGRLRGRRPCSRRSADRRERHAAPTGSEAGARAVTGASGWAGRQRRAPWPSQAYPSPITIPPPMMLPGIVQARLRPRAPHVRRALERTEAEQGGVGDRVLEARSR